jgi:hypothetical protein
LTSCSARRGCARRARARAVAHREEARRGQLDDERRGDGDFGLLHAEALAAGGHRHQAQAAVEVGHRQRDFGLTLGVERHRAAEQIDQAHLLRQALGRLGRGVAAELELALLAVHLFDQAAVDVVEVVPVAQLGEEETVRVGAGLKRVMLRMPTSTADSVTIACWPLASGP